MTGRATHPEKLLYLAPRPQGVDQAAFVRRWQQHGELNMGFSYFDSFTHYEQCPVLGPADEPGLPAPLFGPGGMSTAYGGVGEAFFHGGAQKLAALADDPDAALAIADETPTFGGPLGPDVLWAQDETIFDSGDATVRIYSFLHRQAGLTLDDFADQWRGFAETFLAASQLTRHCASYVQSHVYETLPGRRFDGVAIMGFRSIDDVVAFVSEPSLAGELFPAEEPFIDRSHGVAVITRPNVLLSRRAA